MTTKKCPKCNKRKELDQFGKRKYKGKTYAQSHCIKCRSIKPKDSKRKPTKRVKKSLPKKPRTAKKPKTKLHSTRTTKTDLENKIKDLESKIEVATKSAISPRQEVPVSDQ